MNNGIIIRSNPLVRVVWLELKSGTVKTFWIRLSVTDEQATILRGLGLKVGYTGETVIAALGEDWNLFHNPTYVIVPTNTLYLSDSRQSDHKCITAGYFFADHMLTVNRASVLDDELPLLIGEFKLLTDKIRTDRRSTHFQCYGKISSVPEEWLASPLYIKTLEEIDKRSEFSTLTEFMREGIRVEYLTPIHRKLIEKYIQITS